MKDLVLAFTPNSSVSKKVVTYLSIGYVTTILVAWSVSAFRFLPSPSATISAFIDQWQQGLLYELVNSISANAEAMLIASILSLGLAYFSTMPGLRPIIEFLCKLRFLSMVGLSFYFTILTSSQHQLKEAMQVFSISVFYLTGMMDVIRSIPKEQYDLARTVRMGPWQTMYEVVILGQIDKAFDVARQNFAIGWMMLTMVEGMTRSDGGIGAMMLTANKHFYLEAIIAIQTVVLLVGVLQDRIMVVLKDICCPYAKLEVEKH